MEKATEDNRGQRTRERGRSTTKTIRVATEAALRTPPTLQRAPVGVPMDRDRFIMSPLTGEYPVQDNLELLRLSSWEAESRLNKLESRVVEGFDHLKKCVREVAFGTSDNGKRHNKESIGFLSKTPDYFRYPRKLQDKEFGYENFRRLNKSPTFVDSRKAHHFNWSAPASSPPRTPLNNTAVITIDNNTIIQALPEGEQNSYQSSQPTIIEEYEECPNGDVKKEREEGEYTSDSDTENVPELNRLEKGREFERLMNCRKKILYESTLPEVPSPAYSPLHKQPGDPGQGCQHTDRHSKHPTENEEHFNHGKLPATPEVFVSDDTDSGVYQRVSSSAESSSTCSEGKGVCARNLRPNRQRDQRRKPSFSTRPYARPVKEVLEANPKSYSRHSNVLAHKKVILQPIGCKSRDLEASNFYRLGDLLKELGPEAYLRLPGSTGFRCVKTNCGVSMLEYHREKEK